MQAENDGLRSQLEDCAKKVRTADGELALSLKEKAEAEECVVRKEQELDRMMKTLRASEGERNGAISNLKGVERELKELREGKQTLEAELAAEKKARAETAGELQRAEEKREKSVGKLKAAIAKYEGINQDLLTNLKIKDSSICTWKACAKQLQDQVHGLQKELQVQETNLSFGDTPTPTKYVYS